MGADEKKPYEKTALEKSKEYEVAMTEYRRNGGGASPAKQPKMSIPVPEDDDDEDDEEDEEDDDEEDDE